MVDKYFLLLHVSQYTARLAFYLDNLSDGVYHTCPELKMGELAAYVSRNWLTQRVCEENIVEVMFKRDAWDLLLTYLGVRHFCRQ